MGDVKIHWIDNLVYVRTYKGEADIHDAAIDTDRWIKKVLGKPTGYKDSGDCLGNQEEKILAYIEKKEGQEYPSTVPPAGICYPPHRRHRRRCLLLQPPRANPEALGLS